MSATGKITYIQRNHQYFVVRLNEKCKCNWETSSSGVFMGTERKEWDGPGVAISLDPESNSKIITERKRNFGLIASRN